MLSINFRRGLFRLWTVASFVWLVIAGGFEQEGIRRDVSALMTAEVQPPAPQVGQVFSGKGKPWEKYRTPPPGFVPEDPGVVLEEEARALKALQAADRAGNEEDARRLAAYVMLLRQARSKSGQEASSASPGSWKADPLVSELDELRASLLAGTEDTRTPSQRAQDNLMVSASVLFLPPILLFALGWTGLWIMKGFRS